MAYRVVIADTLKTCKEKYPDEINHGQYGLYDFDFDNMPELFVKIYGTTTLDEYIYVYDFDGNNTVFLGEFEGAHSWVYGTDKANAFLTESYWMGESVWTIYELKNGKFVSEKLAAYYPDGYGDIIEPQENPLPGMGYEITAIDYYNLDNYSH